MKKSENFDFSLDKNQMQRYCFYLKLQQVLIFICKKVRKF